MDVWVGWSHTSILILVLDSRGLFTTHVKFSSNSVQPIAETLLLTAAQQSKYEKPKFRETV